MFLYTLNLVGLLVFGGIACSPIAIPLSLVFYYRDDQMVKKYVDKQDPSAGYRMVHIYPLAMAIRALFKAYAVSFGLVLMILLAINMF